MQYKNIHSTHPNEVTRMLRRLWRVECFDGPAEEDTPTIEETVVAFNELDVHRLIGKRELVVQPEVVHYVTWPPLDNPGSDVYRIDNPTDGPYGKPIKPSIPLPVEEAWDF